MQLRTLFILLYISLFTVQEINGQSTIYLEGTWQIVDWTIIDFYDRNWEAEKPEIQELFVGLQIEFTANNRFKELRREGKPLGFKTINNNYWENIGEDNHLIIGIKDKPDSDIYQEIFTIVNSGNNKIFIIGDDFVFQIRKVADKKSGQTAIPIRSNIHSNEQSNIRIISKTYTLEDLDLPPIPVLCKNVNEKNLLVCFTFFIKTEIFRNIDYNIVNGNISIIVKFIIDESGKIITLNVISGVDKIDQELKDSLNSLPHFDPGFKNGNPVLTEYQVRFNLISFK